MSMEAGDYGERSMNLLLIAQWGEPEPGVRGGSMTLPPTLLGNREHEGTQVVHDGNIGIKVDVSLLKLKEPL
jgi:hypothetical protein